MFIYYLLIGVLCTLACVLIERRDLCRLLDTDKDIYDLDEKESKRFDVVMTIGLMIWCAITALLWPIAIMWEATYIIRRH